MSRTSGSTVTVSDEFDEGPDTAASEWFLRRRDPAWADSDETAFRQWLAADPAHQAAYDSAEALWIDLAEVSRPAVAHVGAPPASVAGVRVAQGLLTEGRGSRAWSPRNRSSRAWSSGRSIAVAACLLASAGGWFAWVQAPRYEVTLATARDETRQLALPDGSQIDVNVDTEVRVRYYVGRREVQVNGGEAFFSVTPDASRPFTVDSGRSRTTVVGTRFNLRAEPERLVVKVLEGQVQVQPDRQAPAAQGRPVVLGPLQVVSVDAASRIEMGRVAGQDSVGDWRSGRLVFRRTPVTEVLRLTRLARISGNSTLKRAK